MGYFETSSSPTGRAAHAVEIPADADRVDPGDLADVIDVRHHVGERRPRKSHFLAKLLRQDLAIRLAQVLARGLLGHAGIQRLGVGRVVIAEFLRDEAAVEVHLHHAALLGQGHDHIIGHVARVVGQRPARRMRREDRRLADLQRVPKGLVGDVRDVHHHAQAVHLADHLLAEIRQPVVVLDLGVVDVARGIRPIVGVGVRERHVAHAQIVVIAQQPEAVFDGVAAFDPHQRGDFSPGVRLFDLFCGGRQDEIVGITSNNVVAHRIDHLQRAVGRPVAIYIRGRHVDREELRPHAAFLEPRDVGMPGTGARADVESFHGAAGNVVMGIDEQRRAVDPHHLGIGDGPGLRVWPPPALRNHGQEQARPHKYLL